VQTLGVKALAIQADSAEASEVVAAVERTVSELGGIDILVNNAGVLAIINLRMLFLIYGYNDVSRQQGNIQHRPLELMSPVVFDILREHS